jgi:predicted acylesterase/phospholipase RssA
VLGGGGAKAAAHLGAAVALRDAGITPVHYVGASMGSVVAAALAGGADPAELLARFTGIGRGDVLQREQFAILKGVWAPAIFRSAPFRATVERLVTHRSFDELATPCTVAAVERDTGDLVAFGADGEAAPLIDALMASCALPPWFRPVELNGRHFYDGGLRAPLPLPLAERVSCDLVIAIDVGPGFDESGTPVEVPPPLLAATDVAIGWLMAGTTELLRERWERRPDLPPLLHVRPTADRSATFAVERIGEYGRAGERAMREALRKLG